MVSSWRSRLFVRVALVASAVAVLCAVVWAATHTTSQASNREPPRKQAAEEPAPVVKAPEPEPKPAPPVVKADPVPEKPANKPEVKVTTDGGEMAKEKPSERSREERRKRGDRKGGEKRREKGDDD